MTLNYTLVVTGPAYGTQQASSAYQFATALISKGHSLNGVFFYREGITNANQFTLPAGDEFNLVKAWQDLAQRHNVSLNVCVAAALRRGVIDKREAEENDFNGFNLQKGFQFSGLGSLAEMMLSSDRVIQF